MSQENTIAAVTPSVGFSIVRRQNGDSGSNNDSGNNDGNNSITDFTEVSGAGGSSHLFPRYLFGVIIVAVLILIGMFIVAYYYLRKRKIRKRTQDEKTERGSETP